MSKETKTYGLRDEDFQMLSELNVTARNVQRHLALFLTMLARDQYGYKETENLQFEVDWAKKQVVIRERDDGGEGTTSPIETA